VSEWGKSKRMNGLASWGTCRAAARERRERRALSRALHGGVEVAAAGGSGRVARRGERSARATVSCHAMIALNFANKPSIKAIITHPIQI